MRKYCTAKNLAAVFLCITAVVWLSYKLVYFPLRGDEVYVINIISRPNFAAALSEWNFDAAHPPLYYILIWLFTKIFGVSEFTVRFFSVICSVGAVLCIYLLSKKLFSLKEAVISCLIALTAYPFLQTASISISYSLLLFLSVLSMLFLADIINLKENKIPGKTVLRYVLTAICCIYTHYFGFLLIFCEIFFILIATGKKYVKQTGIIALIIVISQALYMPFILKLLKEKSSFFTEPANFANWLSWHVFGGGRLVNIMVMFLLMFLMWYSIKKRMAIKGIMPEIMLFFLGCVPYILIYVVDGIILKSHNYRYMIISIVPFYILTARSIVVLSKGRLAPLSVITVIFIFSLFTRSVQRRMADAWRLSLDSPERAIVFICDNYGKFLPSIVFLENEKFFKYYLEKYGIAGKYEVRYTKNSVKTNSNYIEKNVKYIWCVDYMDGSAENQIHTLLGKKYKLLLRQNYYTREVFLYKV